MRKIKNLYKKNIKMNKEVFSLLLEKFGLTKGQSKVFKEICTNISNIQIEHETYIYYFIKEIEGTKIYITNPFFKPLSEEYANPFVEYSDEFENSNFIELINEIKDIISEDMKQEEVLALSKEFIQKFADRIREKFREENDTNIEVYYEINLDIFK